MDQSSLISTPIAISALTPIPTIISGTIPTTTPANVASTALTIPNKGNIFSIFQWISAQSRISHNGTAAAEPRRLLTIHSVEQVVDLNQLFTGNFIFLDDSDILDMRQWLSNMTWTTLGIGIERLTAMVHVNFFKSVALGLPTGKYIITFFSDMSQRLVSLLLSDVTPVALEGHISNNDDIITVYDTETGRVLKFPRIPVVSFTVKSYDMSWLSGR